MKKKLFLMFSLLFMTSFGIINVKADQSGGSTGYRPGSSGNSSYKNGRVYSSEGYRVSIVRYQKGVDNKPVLIESKSKNYLSNDANVNLMYGDPVYYVKNPVPKTSELDSDGNSIEINWEYFSKGSIPSYGYGPFVFNVIKQNGNDTFNYGQVNNYFAELAKPENTNQMKTFLKNEMNFELETLETCNDIRYYYILVEPMLAVTVNHKYYFGTVSEISTVYNALNIQMSKYLFTPDTNFVLNENGQSINISFWYSGVGYNPGGYTNILGKNGYGVSTLWIGGLSSDCAKCYAKSTKTTGGDLKCINTDQNNYEKFTEEYKEVSCDKITNEEETNTKNGKLIAKNANCNMYCIESAIANFPGNISEVMMKRTNEYGGTFFMWPTKEKNSTYSMIMNTKYTCTAMTTSGKTCSSKDIESLKSTVTTKIGNVEHSASLTAGNNLKLDSEKLASDSKINDYKDGDKYIFEKISYFSIPSGKNRYIDKSNGNILNYAKGNYYDRGEGTISLNSETQTNVKHEMVLSNLKLGVFTKDLPGSYACNYSLKDNNNCICPPNTYRTGESLDEELANKPDKTCAELQEEVCKKVSCIDEKGIEKDITSCVREQEISGKSYDEAYKVCSDEVCYSNDKTYYCLDNKGEIYKKNGKPVELNTCMKEYEEKGMSNEEAHDACFKEKCNICYTSDGRTVDIEACMKDYKNYATCENLYCPNSTCPSGKCIYYCKDVKKGKCNWKVTTKKDTRITIGYKCDDSSKGVNKFCNWINLQCPGGNEKMKNPEACVSGKLGFSSFAEVTKALNSGKIKASDVSKAFEKCETTVCPGKKKNSKKIIYRTVDLTNPFPGKDGNKRTPGENWNSTVRIEREILKGRGTTGYDIYGKEPLVTITLTPNVIKKIKEYNKNNEYSDFKLKQVKASKKISGYYISTFIREELSENVVFSGNCKNITTVETFNKCYNNDF